MLPFTFDYAEIGKQFWYFYNPRFQKDYGPFKKGDNYFSLQMCLETGGVVAYWVTGEQDKQMNVALLPETPEDVLKSAEKIICMYEHTQILLLGSRPIEDYAAVIARYLVNLNFSEGTHES